MKAVNQDFGIYSVSKDSEPIALLEKIEQEDKSQVEEAKEEHKINEEEAAFAKANDYMSKVTVVKHNILY